MKKKFIAYGLLLVSCLCLLVVGIVTVLATTQREVDAGLFVRFTAEDVDGSVTMYYRIGGSGNWIKNGETIVFNAEDNDNQARTTDLTLDSEVTKSSKYVEFKYEFVNTGSKYYTATMMLETTQRENISLTYKYNDPTETKEYDDFKYAVVVPGETDASNAKTYFIKVGMEDLSRSANFSGTFNWILKGYNLVNNEELVLTNLDYVETATAGTYSAKYNGSPLEDNTLVIPSKLGDSPVTTVGKCEGTLPANTKVVVSEGVTSIGSNAFQGQKGLTEIELPASLTTIDTSAFSSCSNLTSLTFPEDSQLKEIKGSAFQRSGLTEVDLPESLEILGETSLYNTQIETITIPASVTTIGAGALSGGVLKEIILESDEYFVVVNKCLIEKSTGRLIRSLDGFTEIPTTSSGSPVVVTNIDNYAMMGVGAITTLIIPEGVTRIGNYGITSGYKVTTLTLPSTLIETGYYCLTGMKITKVEIPENMQSIGYGTFARCEFIEEFSVNENNQHYKVENNCLIHVAQKTLVRGCINSIIPTDGSVNKLMHSSFSGVGISEITIPNTIENIGNYVFDACKNLTSIEIPSSVTSFGVGPFKECSNLTNIKFENPTGWKISASSAISTYEEIPSKYDLTDGSVVAELFKTIYLNYYWKCNL